MTYSEHSFWSDPKGYATALTDLPTTPDALPDALEEFLIHHAAARAMGFGVPDYAETDRSLRSVARLLHTAFGRDPRSLMQHRDLPHYLYGTCHDFSLIAASVLRSAGWEVRLRVGFVDYLKPGYWEDHWVCEYRAEGEWRLLDGQLGRRARDGFGIAFDPADVPRSGFLSGPEMWLALRSGEVDPDRCGVSFAGIAGAWFAGSNVLKDLAALTVVEVLPWDFWGPSRVFCESQAVDSESAVRLDQLAAALTPAPDSLEDALAISDRFPWAKPTDRVWSFFDGRLHQQAVRPETP
ncbi:MAG: transglutaminase domain-containing protein [Pseudomonadota bacterium]